MSSVTIQLFAKAPVAGRVKTRLVPPLTPSDAARLHLRMLEHAARQVRDAAARVPGARGELWCAPDTDDAALRRVAGESGLALHAQVDGDLGRRMSDALARALPGSGLPGRVVLLGSDAPALTSDHIVAALGALDDRDAVVIPAADGGYVLIGCRDTVPRCFDAMPWSTSAVMRETRARLDAAGARWIEMPPLWDVDSAADLSRIAGDRSLAHLLAGLPAGHDASRATPENHSV